MSASWNALLLLHQSSPAQLSSIPALMATAFLTTTYVTSPTTAGTIQMRTPISAVRPPLMSDWWHQEKDSSQIHQIFIFWIDLFFHHYLSEGFSTRCNFEFDLCSWRQCQDDDFDWLLKAGSTPTFGTGPSTDHTLRDPSGHYIYLESSFPQAVGDTARVTGPLLSSRSSECKVRPRPKGRGWGLSNSESSSAQSKSLVHRQSTIWLFNNKEPGKMTFRIKLLTKLGKCCNFSLSGITPWKQFFAKGSVVSILLKIRKYLLKR